jgi:DNA-binding MarR family transcriptional regulator
MPDAMSFGWLGLLQLDQQLHEQRNIRLLTPEARVLIHLKLNGPVSVTTAMQVAGTSYRGFYAVLERLRQAGIIATVKDEQDQRVRRLSLDSSVPISPSSY